MSYDPRDDTEVYSLGTLLVKTGAITRDDLADTIQIQKEMSEEDLLGALLIRRGLLNEEQLTGALRVQRDLRSGNRHRRALAAAELARTSARALSQVASRLQEAVWDSKRRRSSSSGYPAVTATDLEKSKA